MLLYMQAGIGFVYNLERTLFAEVHLPDNRLFGGLMAARCNASIQISTNSIIGDEMNNQQPVALNNNHACVPMESGWSYSLYSEL